MFSPINLCVHKSLDLSRASTMPCATTTPFKFDDHGLWGSNHEVGFFDLVMCDI